MYIVKSRAPELVVELLESAVENKDKTIRQAKEALEMWVKFWNADNDENSLEPLLARTIKKKERKMNVLMPNQIIIALRNQAQDCEDSERDPVTGISTWPKETTLQWQAADLIEERKREIDTYEDVVDQVRAAVFDLRAILGYKNDDLEI